MKKLFAIFSLLLCIFTVRAQSLVVKSFSIDENDNSAFVPGTALIDQNGRKCAIIKVKTIIVGLSFDVGSLGIVKTEQKVGEIWVYVPEGVKRITISHNRFGIVRDYDLGQTLKQAKTYILLLAIEGTTMDEITVNSKKTVSFQLIPHDAVVEVDGQVLKSEIGIVATLLSPGIHNYRVSASGYKTKEGELTVNDTEKDYLINISLDTEDTIEKCPIDFSVYPDIETIKAQHPPKIVFTIDTIKFTMIYVEGGDMQINNKEDSKSHVFSVASFYIGETEITQNLWETIMMNNPSCDLGPMRPVNCITWTNCMQFIERLRVITGVHFRLPTENEWEYAARGGQQSRHYKYSGGNKLKEVAWYDKNAYYVNMDKIAEKYGIGAIKEHIGAQKVKTKKANELGLYDMTGNVWEWCMDEVMVNYDTNLGPMDFLCHYIRGGGWDSNSLSCDISNRFYCPKDKCNESLGMRLVLILQNE